MSETSHDHPTAELLRAFGLGQVSDVDLATIEAHLANCASCCTALSRCADSDPLLSRLQEAAAGDPGSADRRLAVRAVLLGMEDAPRQGADAPTAPLPGQPATLPIQQSGGDAVPGYEILAEVGRGGMGVVYRARHRALNRPVALKMVLAGQFAAATQRARLRREAELAARVRHPNIVQVYEVGEHAGRPYLAMEWIEGGTLTEFLHARPLAPRTAAALVEVLARAVHAAHRQGVVHRDLKPGNILMHSGNADGGLGTAQQENQEWPSFAVLQAVPKIADFGLARALHGGQALTESGSLLGTPEYMAPEMVGGNAAAAGPAVDVYALGVILYEAVAGYSPFQAGDALAVLRMVAEYEPPSLREVRPSCPRDLETICQKGMEKDPARRYPSALALADDLGRFLRAEPITARRVGRVERVWKWSRRKPTLALLMVVLLLVAGVGFPGAVWLWADADAARTVAQERESDAVVARNDAQSERDRSQQQAAELLLERGLERAHNGQIAVGLHWMLAALKASNDPDFQRLVRIHLGSWAQRISVLEHWLDTPHPSAAFNPNGKLLATAGRIRTSTGAYRGAWQIWDVSAGRPVAATVLSDDHGIVGPCFSPDSQRLLTANGNLQRHQKRPGWATRWSVRGGQLVGKLLAHRDAVLRTAWSRDGKHMFTTGEDRTVIVWDAQTGKPTGQPLPHPGSVDNLVVSPDGRWLLTNTNRTICLWDWAAGRRKAVFPFDKALVCSIDIAPDGRTLLAGIKSGAQSFLWTHRWDPVQGALVGTRRLEPSRAVSLAFLPDGRLASLRARDVSPDGQRYLQFGEGIQVWRFACARGPTSQIDELPPDGFTPRPPEYTFARFSSDGSTVWTLAGHPRWVQAWDVIRAAPIGFPAPQAGWFDPVHLATTRDGNRVATVEPGMSHWSYNPVQVRETRTGRVIGSPLKQQNAVATLAFSPNGKWLATGGHYHTVALWDARTGAPGGTPLGQGQMINALAFSPDSRFLAVGTFGREVRVWELRTGRMLYSPLELPKSVERVRFSPDGTRLLAGCADGACLWEVRTGQRIAVLAFSGEPASVGESGNHRVGEAKEALFSPNGQVVLTGNSHGAFRLWSAATGQPLGRPSRAGVAGVCCYAFSPDGRFVLVGRYDGTTQLWEASTMRPLGAPVHQRGRVVGVAFHPNGRAFFTVAVDGTIRTWPTPSPLAGAVERIERALQLATAMKLDRGQDLVPLTRDEWEERRARWRRTEGKADWALVREERSAAWHDARAQDAEEAGRYWAARHHLDHLLTVEPGNWLVHARRGRTHTEEGRFSLARQDYEKAARLAQGDDLPAWYRHRAWVCFGRRHSEAALWYLEQLLAASPKDWRLHQLRAAVHAQQGRQSDRETDLARAIEFGADDFLLEQVAEERARQGRQKKAVELLFKAYDRPTSRPELLVKAGLLSLLGSRLADYRRACEQLLAVWPAVRADFDPYAAAMMARLWLAGPDAFTNWTQVLARLEAPIVQLRQRKAVAHDPTIRLHLSAWLQVKGGVLLRAGRSREAIPCLLEALDLRGQGAAFHDRALLALAYLHSRQPAAAKPWVDQVRAEDFARADPHAWPTREGRLLREEVLRAPERK